MNNDIFTRLNDLTFYTKSDREPKLVKVIRRMSVITKELRQMIKKMTLLDFYNPKNTKLFALICPPLVLFKGTNFVGMWLNICIGKSGGRDFLIVRKNFGEVLQAVGEIMTGDPITDRGGIQYNFGKPIELEELLELYRKLINRPENNQILTQIVVKSQELRKHCTYRTRGIGSITKVINKIA